MTDTPKGYERNDKGVLVHTFALRRDKPTEAVWFMDGHGERFGCTEVVYSGSRDMSGHSCGKPAKHDLDHNGNPTRCGIHSEAAKAKRRAKSEAKYQAERAKWARQAEQNRLLREAPEIIRKIAEGHNDPRALAKEWLAKYAETKA